MNEFYVTFIHRPEMVREISRRSATGEEGRPHPQPVLEGIPEYFSATQQEDRA